MSKLTGKRKQFCDEYLIDMNATQAATRAGYSKRTAKSQGQRLLTKVDIQEYLAKLKAKRSVRTEITQDLVLTELAKVGFSDLRKTLTSEGHLIDPQDWDDETAGAISSLEVVAMRGGDDDGPIEYVHKIKMWDKMNALEKMGKHLGMFPTKLEHTSPDGSMSPMAELIQHVGEKGKRIGDS
jgi:phage terminase small subunit